MTQSNRLMTVLAVLTTTAGLVLAAVGPANADTTPVPLGSISGELLGLEKQFFKDARNSPLMVTNSTNSSTMYIDPSGARKVQWKDPQGRQLTWLCRPPAQSDVQCYLRRDNGPWGKLRPLAAGAGGAEGTYALIKEQFVGYTSEPNTRVDGATSSIDGATTTLTLQLATSTDIPNYTKETRTLSFSPDSITYLRVTEKALVPGEQTVDNANSITRTAKQVIRFPKKVQQRPVVTWSPFSLTSDF